MSTHEQRHLASLKNRPGLEPEPEFSKNMKALLAVKKKKQKWNGFAFFAAITAFGIATVIILSFLSLQPEKLEMHSKGTRSTKNVEKEVNQSPLKEQPEVTFELTQEEIVAYRSFKVEYNDSNLKNLSPISVAKLYVQAALDEDYETQYELFTTRPDGIRWTKEEHLNFPAEDRGSKEDWLQNLGGIAKGRFIKENDDKGHIEFQTPNGKGGFQMIKDISGVWKVSFMPIQ